MKPTILLCSGLFAAIVWAPIVTAHPDSPLEFRKHQTNDGRAIYSNIPKRCFSNGLLTCHHLHPVVGSAQPPQTEAQAGEATGNSDDRGTLEVKMSPPTQ